MLEKVQGTRSVIRKPISIQFFFAKKSFFANRCITTIWNFIRSQRKKKKN